jgi:hypothetical protein
MSENILNFPVKEKVDANAVLEDAKDKLEDCILLGVTKEGEAYYSICAQDPAQVVYLLRALEHIVITMELQQD